MSVPGEAGPVKAKVHYTAGRTRTGTPDPETWIGIELNKILIVQLYESKSIVYHDPVDECLSKRF